MGSERTFQAVFEDRPCTDNTVHNMWSEPLQSHSSSEGGEPMQNKSRVRTGNTFTIYQDLYPNTNQNYLIHEWIVSLLLKETSLYESTDFQKSSIKIGSIDRSDSTLDPNTQNNTLFLIQVFALESKRHRTNCSHVWKSNTNQQSLDRYVHVCC